MTDADVIVVGAGLAGLVATAELIAAGRRVIVVEQEPESALGGQAFWSLGGLFLVDSPEQRRLRIRDSYDLALADWMATAGFDRPEDDWARRWAEAYVAFSAGEKRAWLRSLGVRFFPLVGWAERRSHQFGGSGNSVPRFHIAWGTGPAVIAPFVESVRSAVAARTVEVRYRHRVDGLIVSNGVVTGVRGSVLEPDAIERGKPSSRRAVSEFSEQNPDLTGRNLRLLLARLRPGGAATEPIEAFKRHGVDFVVRDSIEGLVDGMNRITSEPLMEISTVRRGIAERDLGDGPNQDAQIAAINDARRYLSERVLRVVRPRPLLEPACGPLIAVRLRTLTRKSLGGLRTDLDARVLDGEGQPIRGLFAAGEAAGFGGGGVHGYRALEGTFLGGCIFSGRIAGRAAARST